MQWIAGGGGRFPTAAKDAGLRLKHSPTPLRVSPSVAARTYSATQFMTTPMLQATIDIHEHAALFFEAALAREREGHFGKSDAMRRQGIALLEVLRSSVLPESGVLGADLARIYDYLRSHLSRPAPTEVQDALETAVRTLHTLLDAWRARRSRQPAETQAAH